jgi:hypothetical protein
MRLRACSIAVLLALLTSCAPAASKPTAQAPPTTAPAITTAASVVVTTTSEKGAVLEAVDLASMDELAASFNEAGGIPKLILLLSPT